jgi:two-component system chemotaxis response regulator CheB
VVRKVLVTRHLKRETLQPLPPYAREHMSESGSFPVVEPRYESFAPDSEPEATRLVVIAASTGGPAALTRILAALPGNLDAGVLVVQHMPSRFTTTFAERLNRQCELNVIEPDGQQVLRRGTVHIAPGDRCIEVHHGMDGLVVRVVQPNLSDRYTPSADRLFASAAKWMRRNLLAVVLTGMGDDGKAGVEEVAGSGGLVIAESEETAVVDGMPRAAIATGVVTRVERLERLAELIEAFAGRF